MSEKIERFDELQVFRCDQPWDLAVLWCKSEDVEKLESLCEDQKLTIAIQKSEIENLREALNDYTYSSVGIIIKQKQKMNQRQVSNVYR